MRSACWPDSSWNQKTVRRAAMSSGHSVDDDVDMTGTAEITTKRNRASRSQGATSQAAGKQPSGGKGKGGKGSSAAGRTGPATPAASPSKGSPPNEGADSPAGLSPPLKQPRPDAPPVQVDQQRVEDTNAGALTMTAVQKAVLSVPETDAQSTTSHDPGVPDRVEVGTSVGTPAHLHMLAHPLAHPLAHQLFRLARTQRALRVDASRPPLKPTLP